MRIQLTFRNALLIILLFIVVAILPAIIQSKYKAKQHIKHQRFNNEGRKNDNN